LGKSDCVKREKLFCWVLSIGFDGRKLLLEESHVHPLVAAVRETATSRYVYVNFTQAERSNGINRGGSVVSQQKQKGEGRKKEELTWQRESRLEITIFISIKGSEARSYPLFSASEGNLLSRCPENYPAFAPRTLSLRGQHVRLQ